VTVSNERAGEREQRGKGEHGKKREKKRKENEARLARPVNQEGFRLPRKLAIFRIFNLAQGSTSSAIPNTRQRVFLGLHAVVSARS
jgi:hypothetical protein